jgi:DNA-binding MarR family transcriptional regulator
MDKGKRRRFARAREDAILEKIVNNEGIRIKDLAKKLGMWDGNLRRNVERLVKKGIVAKYVENDYVCVKIKKKKLAHGVDEGEP